LPIELPKSDYLHRFRLFRPESSFDPGGGRRHPVGCGRMGTMNEFTIAFEDKKPIGISGRRRDTRKWSR